MKQINQSEFEQETKSGVTVVDFFATWCGPCRAMAMILEDVANEHPEFNIVKIDVDQNNELARRFGILSIPTIVIMKDGEMVDKHIGLMEADGLVELVERYI